MAITRKPKAAGTTKEASVEALINKGGSTPKAQGQGETTAVIIRLPPDMLAKVNAAVASRPIRTPRHTWILEAIHEKLQR
jgi:hypothetical protein